MIGAALLTRALVEGEVDHLGICFAEQVVPPNPLFERLTARGLVPVLEIVNGEVYIGEAKGPIGPI